MQKRRKKPCAIEKWYKLKSVIIKPARGGEKRRTSAFARWKNNMDDWLTGNWEGCLNRACCIEKRRQDKNKKKNLMRVRKSDEKVASKLKEKSEIRSLHKQRIG